MVQKRMTFADPPDVSQVPNVEAVIVVHAAHLRARLIKHNGDGVGIFGGGRGRHHVTNLDTLRDVDAQVVSAR